LEAFIQVKDDALIAVSKWGRLGFKIREILKCDF